MLDSKKKANNKYDKANYKTTAVRIRFGVYDAMQKSPLFQNCNQYINKLIMDDLNRNNISVIDRKKTQEEIQQEQEEKRQKKLEELEKQIKELETKKENL